MIQGQGMRNKDLALYVLSGVLFAVTIPMYRYMHAHAHDAPVSVSVAPVPSWRAVSSPPLRPSERAELSEDRAKLAVYRSMLNDQYQLAPDQRCVGGAVIEVHGNVYTQLGSISQPVHCVGRRADRVLR